MNVSSITLEAVCQQLAQIAPLQLAESWDNVGLLVGKRSQAVARVMTCLTIAPDVVAEAIEQDADLVIAHHPLPFSAIQKITSDTIVGSMLIDLIGARIAVYSAHTAFDSAAEGINQQWAQRLQLQKTRPLTQSDQERPEVGAGRIGELPAPRPLGELVCEAARLVSATSPRLVGPSSKLVSRIAVACGSGGSFLAAARRQGCDALITGEANFHSCLEAESSDIGLGLLGHYWSERFAMEWLAEQLGEQFEGLRIWASHREHDPIQPLTP